MKHKAREKNFLSQRIKITQWEIQQPYICYDLSPLHSISIDSNKKFIQLKIIIEEYNSEIKQFYERNRKDQGIVHGGMRRNYIDTLYKMLNDISQMKDEDIQRRYLDDVHEWAEGYDFTKKSRPGTGDNRLFTPLSTFTRPNTGATGGNMRKKLLDYKSQELNNNVSQFSQKSQEKGMIFENILTEQTQMRKQSYIDRQKQRLLLTTQMKQIADQRRDFRMLHRTVHPLLKVATERLKQYPRRKRLDIQIEKPINIFNNIPRAPKPKIEQPKDDDYYFDDDINLDEQLEMQQVKVQQQQQPVEVAVEIQDVNDIEFGGEPDQDAEPQQAEQQEIVDKLAPRVKVYKDFHIPINDDVVKITNNRNFKEKNNELMNVIMDIESTKYMQNQWGKTKGKWNSGTARNREVAKLRGKSATMIMRQNLPTNVSDLTQYYVRPATTVRQQSAKLVDIEKNFNSFRVKNVVDTEIGNIKLTKLEGMGNLVTNTDGSTKIRSLSAHVSPSYRRRDFSQILIQGRQQLLAELDSELIALKERLAGNRVTLQQTKIKAGIQIGQANVRNIYEEIEFNSINGRSLMNNPFFKVGKKKKKKKKKK